MKKIISILTVAFMAFVFSSSITAETKKSEPQVSVGDDNFKKLVAYIEKNGSVYSKKNPCTFFYTFVDKDGNECKMNIVRTNEDGMESPKGTIGNIRCVLFCKGACDYNVFYITKDKLLILNEKDLNIVKRGYYKLLAQANEDENEIVFNSNK